MAIKITKHQLKQIIKEEVFEAFGKIKPIGKFEPTDISKTKEKVRPRTPKAYYKPPIAPNPPKGIRKELWERAYQSFLYHETKEKNFSSSDGMKVALVDFSIAAAQPRLWVVNLYTGKIIFGPVHVSHGRNSGPAGGAVRRVGNTLDSNVSSIGAFKTGTIRGSYAGRLGCQNIKSGAVVEWDKVRTFDETLGSSGMWRCKDGFRPLKGLAMELDGLDKSNNLAFSGKGGRHILFHGASYVMPNSKIGNSNGCFATHPATNEKLISLLGAGSFVYAAI
jgi:hypothetical protein